ncbi:MAG: signal peptidase I [Rubricoccaceae bacterium]|nr:signal peptidase I [Rubricoccaceae bacterium]
MRKLRSWFRVVLIAFLAALLLRLFAFEAYRIPSESMEETLLVGDFLFVSKLSYGARTPITLGIPFTGYYVEAFELPSVRLPGLGTVNRGDVVVFNYPPDPAPIDRKASYIKRVAGLPGDTLMIENKQLIVAGQVYPIPETGQQMWRVFVEDESSLPTALLDSLGISGRLERVASSERVFRGTAAESQIVAAQEEVRSVEPYIRSRGDRSAQFPAGGNHSLDAYGPVVVPKWGMTVALDDETWPLYRRIITEYEGHDAQQVAGGYEISGSFTSEYTFEQDYFFVLGDNRDDSSDSRSWGFVPASHLIGKALMIYFSWDPHEDRPRWDRLFRGIE